MSNQPPERSIVRRLADHTCKRVARQTIRWLQKLDVDLNLMQSVGDLGLSNVWEEVCVQAQYENSWFWDTYEYKMFNIVKCFVEKLQPHELDAVWLFTPEGEEWDCEPEDEREPFLACKDDVARYIMQEYLLNEAGRWSNARIRAFQNRPTD